MTISKSVYEQALRDGIRVFQDAIGRADVPLHTFEIFLTISEKTPPTTEDVKKLFPSLSHSAVSRNIQILTATSNTRKDGGFPLCEYVVDPKDRRYKYIHLTKLGKEVRDSIFANGTRLINDFISA